MLYVQGPEDDDEWFSLRGLLRPQACRLDTGAGLDVRHRWDSENRQQRNPSSFRAITTRGKFSVAERFF
jgi:hypothetical protein